MSIEVVGLENIPNVYISKIRLEDNNSETFKAFITLQIMDVKSSKGYIWKDENSFVDFFKVGMVCTSNRELARTITNGTQSPFPSKIINSDNYNVNQTEIRKLSVKNFQKIKKSPTPSNPGECRYYRTESIELPIGSLTDYVIFVYGFVDTAFLFSHFEIDLSGLLRQYMGAVASEAILEDSKTPSLTNLFLQSDTGVWPGPVHVQDSQYVAGSFSTAGTSQPLLKRIKVQNLKLADLRGNIYKSKSQSPFKINPLIGGLHYSINDNIDLVGIFALNMKQVVLQKTKHGKTFRNISRSLFNEFMFSVEINSLSIVRNQIKTRRVINNLGTPKVAKFSVDRYKYITSTIDEKPNKLKPTDAIQQIYLNQDPTIRYYQFKDDENTAKTSGQFSYKAEISIVDKSQEFFEKKIKAFKLEIDSLEQTIARLNKRRNYSHEENKLKEGIEVPDSIKTAIVSYVTLKTYLLEMAPFEIEAEINAIMISMVSANYTAKMGLKLINDFQSSFTTFRRLFPPIKTISGLTRPKNNKKSMIPNLISFNKEFEQIIQFNDYRRYYRYIDEPYDLGTVISIDTLRERSNLEERRFFNLEQSKFPSEFGNLEDATAQAITNTTVAKQRYLSPLSFIFDNQNFDITDPTNIDYMGLSIQFLRSKQVSDRTIRPWKAATPRNTDPPSADEVPNQVGLGGMRRAPSFNGSFVPSFNVPEFKVEEEKKEILANSRDYLGINSSFNEGESHLNIAILSPDTQVVAALLSTTQAQTGTSKLNFDLTRPDSAISQFIRSNSFMNSKLEDAPVSYKAMVCSRSQAAKNEILATEGDLLQSPDTKISMEILFQANKRLLVLSGYGRDNDGDLMLSEPLWEEMEHDLLPSTGGTIVKMEYAEIPELGLKPNEIFKLPSTNDVIIIGDQPVTIDITTLPDEVHAGGSINMLSKNQLSKVIKYATTNIVTQGTYKNSLQFEVAPDTDSVGAPTIEQVDQVQIGGVSSSPVTGTGIGPNIPGGSY